jgi:hypothetical protein
MTANFQTLNQRMRQLAVLENKTQDALIAAAEEIFRLLQQSLNIGPPSVSYGSEDETREFIFGRVPEFDSSHSSAVDFHLAFPGSPAPRDQLLTVRATFRASRYGTFASIHGSGEVLLGGGGSDMHPYFANQIISRFEGLIQEAEERMQLRS